jgi:hypothetical protein
MPEPEILCKSIQKAHPAFAIEITFLLSIQKVGLGLHKSGKTGLGIHS